MGPKLAARLQAYGVERVEDLLFHFPLRYQDRTRVTPIGGLVEGSEAVVEGEVRGADVTFGRRRSLLVVLQDGTGTLTLRFFHFSNAQKQALRPGVRLRVESIWCLKYSIVPPDTSEPTGVDKGSSSGSLQSPAPPPGYKQLLSDSVRVEAF